MDDPAIIGVPVDPEGLGMVYAPDLIRKYILPFVESCHDLGNMNVPLRWPFDENGRSALAWNVCSSFDIKKKCSSHFPIILGGDHHAAYCAVSHLDRQGLIMFLAEPNSVVEKILEKIPNAILLGMRRPFGEGITLEEIRKEGIIRCVKEAIAKAGKNFHVSIDASVFHPSIVPGQPHPVDAGLNHLEAETAMELLHDSPISSVDIVNVTPLMEDDERAPKYIARLVLKLLGYA